MTDNSSSAPATNILGLLESVLMQMSAASALDGGDAPDGGRVHTMHLIIGPAPAPPHPGPPEMPYGGGDDAWIAPPQPISTAAFPDLRRSIPPARGTKRALRSSPADGCCCVCLETLFPNAVATLPSCHHQLHRRCLFGVLSSGALGAQGMVRCPLCRAAVDRYDCGDLGMDVRPAALRAVAQRCAAVRALTDGAARWAAPPASPSEAVARLVAQSTHTCAADGFVYNCAILAIERSLYHRRTLSLSLAIDLHRNLAPAAADLPAYIDTTVMCHVEVLMHTDGGGERYE